MVTMTGRSAPAPDPWTGHRRGDPAVRRILWAMFAAGFAVFAQVFDAQAALPAIAAQLDLPPSTAALTVSSTTIGLAVSVLPWTMVADRLGRVRAMTISLAVSSVLGILTPLLPTFEAVVAARALTGVMLGAVPAVAMAYFAEEMHADIVAVAAGTFVAGNTIGGIVGRLIAGPLSEIAGWRVALVVVAACAAVSAAVFLRLIPHPRGFAPHPRTARSLAGTVVRHLRNRHLLALYAQGFFVMGSFTVVYNYLGFHVTQPPFDVPTALVSLLFLVYLAGTVTSRWSAVVAQRIGFPRMIACGLALMALGGALSLTPWLGTVLLGMTVFTVGCFCAHPIASGQSGRQSVSGRAQATALYQLAWLSGASLLGWLGGVVYGTLGWPATVGLVAVFTAAAAVALAAGFSGRRARARS